MAVAPTIALNDGFEIPAIGFGTYPLKGDECTAAVLSALEAGYRLIDTAVNYRNEEAVGEALRRTDVPRDEITVTTKLPGRHHDYDLAIASAKESAQRLGVDRIDLYLIHWPNPITGKFVVAWQALSDLQADGLVRSIGVSNFTSVHLTTIIENVGAVPAVNQIELHPLFPQKHMRAVDAREQIRTMSWSPLGKRQAQYDAAPVVAAAQAHGVTPAQVILRWHVELGAIPVPKSGDPRRQRENLDVFGFELTPEEVAAITALGRPDGRLFDGDPNTHEEM